jgi:putative ABC transport system permease protein
VTPWASEGLRPIGCSRGRRPRWRQGHAPRDDRNLGERPDLLASFALLGLGLASLGIYGVIARTMAQRANEFAIRLVLGACVRDISRLVLTSGVKLALIGAGLGLLGALGVSHLLTLGFPALHLDGPPVLIGTTVLLIAVALVACWLPAQRASQVNPVDALRAE